MRKNWMIPSYHNIEKLLHKPYRGDVMGRFYQHVTRVRQSKQMAILEAGDHVGNQVHIGAADEPQRHAFVV